MFGWPPQSSLPTILIPPEVLLVSTESNITPYGRENHSPESRCVTGPAMEATWYAVYTVHKHEKSVFRHLEMRTIVVFFPTYEVVHVWRNRQRVKVPVPLFPGYLFVRTSGLDYFKVLQCPGVVRLVGNHSGPLPIADSVIELLRASVAEKKIEPYRELVAGKRVRVKSGPMRGVEGVLIRKDNSWQFVLTIESINQHASIKMEAENLEPIPDLWI